MESILTVKNVLEKIKTLLKDRPSEPVSLFNGLGRVTADDVYSRTTFPPFDLCSVEGYAIDSAKIVHTPVTLQRVGKAKPNAPYKGTIQEGETVWVQAGSPLPEGADAVVAIENTQKEGLSITIQEHPTQGLNVSCRGIDVEEGDRILKKGTVLTSRHIGLSAAMNVPWLPVVTTPKIGVLVTMDEIAFPDDKDAYQRHNGVHFGESLATALSAFISARGAVPMNLGVALNLSASVDHIIAFKSEIREAIEGMDLLIAIGGLDVPDDSLMWTSLSQGGAELEKLDVAIGTGESIIIGHHDDIPILGFPSNPVSALICASLFLRPTIDQMFGVSRRHYQKSYAVLSRNLDIFDVQTEYLYATYKHNTDDGTIVVAPVSAQDTLMLSVLVQADCLIVVDQESDTETPHHKAGDVVEIIPLTGSIVST